MSKDTIAFAGLGIMGMAMIANLMKNGYPVTACNRSPAKAREAESAGAAFAATPAEAADAADIFIIMVSDDAAVENILFGPKGAAPRLKTKLVINMSTVSPGYAASLAARLADMGVDVIDAPVSGSKKPAEEGTLVILAGGKERLIKKAEPVLLAMGKKVVYCGKAGSGALMKMTINLLLGSLNAAFCEAVRFGQKGGLPMEAILDVVLSGPLANPYLQMKADMLRNDAYPTQFPLRHMAKDLKYVLDTAYANHAHTPMAAAAFLLHELGMARGHGDEDLAVVARVLEEVSPAS